MDTVANILADLEAQKAIIEAKSDAADVAGFREVAWQWDKIAEGIETAIEIVKKHKG